ncbi:outer membrane lipoprotein-sorting protein [Endothiovibrio diazotrophicus]
MKPSPFARLVLLLALLGLAAQAGAVELDPLIRHLDRLWRGETSQATLTMTVKTRRYQRTMSLESWSRGKEHSLMRVLEPIKDRGVATLKVDANIWNYLPKIDRVTKIPASMMAGSWMGSHFTNDDIVRESTFEDDYTSALSFEGTRDGHTIYEITSRPLPDAAVVWGKVVTVLDQTTLAPLYARYYDEEGALVRTMTFDRPEEIDGRVIPMRLTLQPEEKPDESTVVLYRQITFGVPLDDAFFSLRNLKRRR